MHVADEALTGFLAFYNPLVLSLRARLGWWPMPTFAFAPWLAGLIVAIAVLALLTPAVRRGAPLTRIASYALATVMFANGVAHLAGSILYGRWLPGASSAPLLLAASVLLALRTRTRRLLPRR